MSKLTTYHTVEIDGLNLFYRQAGTKDRPTIVLLHGLPSSSHMYRDLINSLSDQFHLIAPGYPGFGNSDTPAIDHFECWLDEPVMPPAIPSTVLTVGLLAVRWGLSVTTTKALRASMTSSTPFMSFIESKLHFISYIAITKTASALKPATESRITAASAPPPKTP
jgi:hypothetical protein